jgi:U4/U6 small nuclear ribonucleoprotein PRP31
MEARTLADSLLDDLNDLSDSDDDGDDGSDKDNAHEHDNIATATSNNVNSQTQGHNGDGQNNNDDDADDHAMQDQGVEENKEIMMNDKRNQPRVRLLLEDKKLQQHLQLVKTLLLSQSNEEEEPTVVPSSTTIVTSSDEMARNYDLIQKSNKWLNALQHEFERAHQTLCDVYRTKFPELEELVTNPVQYLKCVQIIGGTEMDLTMVSDQLNQVLTSNQIITISVAGSTTSGRALSLTTETEALHQACEYMTRVLHTMEQLTTYVSQKIKGLAPNICLLVGPNLAARLVGLAGGLAELSRIPACNLQVMGQTKLSAASRGGLFASTDAGISGGKPHTGILAECDFVQSCPRHLQQKVLKVVSSKVSLAARVDCVNAETGQQQSGSGSLTSAGLTFRHQISQKIQKLSEPHNNGSNAKALPKPDMDVKKRRGGKRMRRLKENYEETELMKQANKRVFSQGTGEYGDDAMGLTMGLLDSSEGGDLRKKSQLKKLRHSNTKASRKKAAQQAAQAKSHASAMASGLHSSADSGSTVLPGHATSLNKYNGSTASGTASSMVFTPVQGMELVDPSRAQADRVKKANAKWFTENAGFQSALPQPLPPSKKYF